MNRRGFTIIELLIVIVVIGVLAAITIVAFNGIQNRARDTQRLSDVKAIVKALESYKAIHNVYPAATPGCWENSNVANFMEYMTADYGLAKAPLDPMNSGTYYYSYCRYSPGTNGCDAGRFFVVVTIKRFENAANNTSPSNWICSGRNWNVDNSNEFAWSWGSYE
jgi:prepilin-type N-terminal cleavage/methylation domain-containing protein